MKSHIDPYEISMIQLSNRKINIFSLSHPGPGFDYHYSCIVKGILNLQLSLQLYCREGTIFGVGLITLEILQIEAKFIVILQCEFTYLRKSYKEKFTFELSLQLCCLKTKKPIGYKSPLVACCST
jgi:hypothetical protein